MRRDKLRTSCYGHLIFAGLDFERSSKKMKGVGEKVHRVTVVKEKFWTGVGEDGNWKR